MIKLAQSRQQNQNEQVKEYLEPMGVSQKDFANHLGWTYARLNEIVNVVEESQQLQHWH